MGGMDMNTGAVVLCGGMSRRMGSAKALLPMGDATFLERILGQLEGFDEVLLSVSGRETELPEGYPRVADRYPGCGPMGGLHAALTASGSDALLAVACDLPLFRRELGQLLCGSLTEDEDAVVPVTPDGYRHPLCAVYRKETAAVFQRCLESGTYKLRAALDGMRVREISVPEELQPCLRNINTPEEYRAIRATEQK